MDKFNYLLSFYFFILLNDARFFHFFFSCFFVCPLLWPITNQSPIMNYTRHFVPRPMHKVPRLANWRGASRWSWADTVRWERNSVLHTALFLTCKPSTALVVVEDLLRTRWSGVILSYQPLVTPFPSGPLALCVSRQVADQRAANLNRLIGDADNAAIEASCFSLLIKAETAAIPRRIKDSENGAAAETEAEELLQVFFCCCCCCMHSTWINWALPPLRTNRF